MRILILLFFVVAITGCSQFLPINRIDAQQEQLRLAEQEDFTLALDILAEEQSVRGLREFRQRYLKGAWAERAAAILLYDEELYLRKQQLERLRAEQQAIQVENQQLLEKIEKLKRLLIELEQRPQ